MTRRRYVCSRCDERYASPPHTDCPACGFLQSSRLDARDGPPDVREATDADYAKIEDRMWNDMTRGGER